MTEINVSTTMGMSATVGEMSATVGEMSATVGEMSATVGKFKFPYLKSGPGEILILTFISIRALFVMII